MANQTKNDVVIVDLDRPRVLRFSYKALKKIEALKDKFVDSADENEDGDGTNLDYEEIETIFFYGFEKDARENGEKLTLEMMEDILDEAPSLSYLMEKLHEAMEISTGGFDGGNFQAPAVQPVNREQRRASGAGKKA